MNKIKFNDLNDELKTFIKTSDIYTIDNDGYIMDDEGNYPDDGDIEDQMNYSRNKE